MAPRPPYPTDLSDQAWDVITHLVPTAEPGGWSETYPERAILDALSSIVRGGCAWRLLPHDLPPRPMVYQSFWRWRNEGTWQRMHDLRRGDIRVAAGKRRQLSAAIVDRPAVKTTETEGAVGTMPASRSTAARVTSSAMPSACASRRS